MEWVRCFKNILYRKILQSGKMFFRIVVILFHFLLAGISVFSQKNKIDSLKASINKAPTDSLRIEALYNYMEATLNNNTSDFEPYVKEMIALSKKIKFKWGLSTAYILALSYYKNDGKYEKALEYGDSVELVIKNDTAADLRRNKAHLHTNRGNLYYNLGDYSKAIEDYLAAEKIFQIIKHKSIANTYNGIANCYMSMGLQNKALDYSNKAIDAARQFDDKRQFASLMMNQATIFMNQGNYHAADSILNVVWPVVSKLDNDKSFNIFYFNKGDVEAFYKKDTLKALEYYNKSYQYALKNEDVWQQCRSLEALLGFQFDLKHEDLKSTLDKLNDLADSNNLDLFKETAYEKYSEWYRLQGDYKKAYEFQKKFKQVSDSLYSEDANEKIASMETRFRVSGKDNEIKMLQDEKNIQQLSLRQKNIFNYIFAGSAIALLIISFMSYRNYSHRKKLQQARIEELETEKKLTATEAVLKGEEQERTRLAKDLHDGLGGMLSGIKYSFQTMKGNLVMTPDNAQAFERSMDMLDSSIKEMRRVAHNMMPEALVKFGLDTALKDFCNDINQSGALELTYQSIGLENTAIEQTTAITLYRIVQELINNTMKHASAKTAIVQVTKTDENISITVEDDGKGFDPAILKQARGIGWSNIQSRVEYLKGKLDVQSEPGKGTSVLIEIKEIV